MTQGKDAGGQGGGTWRRLMSAMFTSTLVNKGMSGEMAQTRRLPQIDNPVLVGAAGVGALAVGAAVRTLRPGRRGGRASRFRVLLARAALSGDHWPDALLAPDDVRVDVHEAFGKPSLVSVDVELRADHVLEVLGGEADLPFEVAGRSGEEVPAGTGPEGTGPESAPAGEGGPAGEGVPAGEGPLEEAAHDAEQIRRATDLLPGATVVDLLTRVVRAAWDNPEIAPVAVRGRILVCAGGATPAKGHHRGGGRPGARATVEGPPPEVLVDMRELGFVDETARPADLYEMFGAPASDPSWRP